jgi:hypothetical protein
MFKNGRNSYSSFPPGWWILLEILAHYGTMAIPEWLVIGVDARLGIEFVHTGR